MADEDIQPGAQNEGPDAEGAQPGVFGVPTTVNPTFGPDEDGFSGVNEEYRNFADVSHQPFTTDEELVAAGRMDPADAVRTDSNAEPSTTKGGENPDQAPAKTKRKPSVPIREVDDSNNEQKPKD